ncbi:MAG: cadmium-translocating P-type ATPase, partial [Deltaproteobacteria bacterium]|nr:cadmium-translocating P-type ATPase [Deltaproteobacteria bacterium]
MKTSSCACCSPDGGENARPVPSGHAPEQGREDASPRRELFVLGLAALVFAAALLCEEAAVARFGPLSAPLLYFAPYCVCGWSVFKSAGRLIASRDFLNEFTLMAGATLVAVGLGQYAEAVGVMLFYRIGEFFQELATHRSRQSIEGLLASKPANAHVLRGTEVVTLPVEAVRPGDSVVVRAGESVPLDGVVLSGATYLDQSPLTGESAPVAATVGDAILGGAINAGGVITLRATVAFADTHMARVLEMVQNAVRHKAPTERFMTRFARYYTPAVVALATLTALLPPLFGGGDWHTWIYRALVLLVISCPCALVISIPLGYFGGIGAASKKGILDKGGTVLDGLTHIDTVVFDKTGTLTLGLFAVTRLAPTPGVSEAELLRAAALAECESNHPLARAVMERARDGFTRPADLAAEEFPGKGMRVLSGGSVYLAGSGVLLRDAGVSAPQVAAPGAVVFVARDGAYLGHVEVEDAVRPDSRAAVAALKARGMKVLMLSGDRKESAARVAKEVEVDGFEAELLPGGKIEALSRLADKDKTAFVGDGINDGPILAL